MFYAQKRVLVTGGASFIGSHVVDALVTAQATVTVVGDLSSGQLENLQTSMHTISIIAGDLRDPTVADQASKDQDLVFHLAAEKIDDCRAVNIGTDEVITIRDAATTILHVVGHHPQQIFFNTAKPEGVHTRAASIRKQKEWLGWQP
jgi:nucleoside-diphosphate-sugar epimerase